uniref:Uncharacterized protein n=1 Tax=Timema poppense TaxID=170557 RepID=A0A7R9DTM7_TIMPO|nr:unnamed protein product [Timema poppensis]
MCLTVYRLAVRNLWKCYLSIVGARGVSSVLYSPLVAALVVEVICRSRYRWCNTLILGDQLPPNLIVVLGCDVAAEHPPAPFVHEEPKGKLRNLCQSLPQQ